MSKYDKASLVMIPSAVKAETLYSVLPVNGDGDFTHDRNNGTATRVNKDGYIETVAEDVPRLDYPLIDGVVQDCPALLLEPSRSNLLLNSEDFTTTWSRTNSTITANQIIAPDGTQTADLLLESTATGSHDIRQNKSGLTTGVSYTYSIFVKQYEGTNTRDRIDFYIGGINSSGSFQFSRKGFNDGYSFDRAEAIYYGNGWYRLVISDVTTGTSFNNILILHNGTTTSYTGDTNSGIYLWGGMLELGSFETSYIKTTTATVTRNADVCDSAGTSAEFNDSEGVLYAEIAALADDLTFRLISLSDGTTSNRLSLGYRSTSNAIYCEIRNANATQAFLITTINDIKTKSKVSVKYKENDFAMWVNGFEVSTDASGITPVNLSQINFDSGQQAGSFFYGRTKELATFKEALTDSELEALTSWDSFTEMATSQEYSLH